MEWLDLSLKVSRVIESSKTEDQRRAAVKYAELADAEFRKIFCRKKLGPISRFFSKLGL